MCPRYSIDATIVVIEHAVLARWEIYLRDRESRAKSLYQSKLIQALCVVDDNISIESSA